MALLKPMPVKSREREKTQNFKFSQQPDSYWNKAR
jgi:hypothetical protein